MHDDPPRARRGTNAIALVLVALWALSACGEDDSTGDTGDPLDARVDAVVDDLNRFWFEELDDFGLDYVAIPRSRVGDGDDGMTCDGVEIAEDEDLRDNAFVDSACREGITVAYDADELARTTYGVELTLSHEWGHVIQAQFPELDAAADGWAIDAELQADCLMGAWAVTVFDPGELDEARDEVADTGDEPGVAVDDPDAHGTPTQRVAAFDLGLDLGAEGCVDELDRVLPE